MSASPALAAFQGTGTKAAFVLLLGDPGASVPCWGAGTLCYRRKEAGCRALEEQNAGAVGLTALKQENGQILFQCITSNI